MASVRVHEHAVSGRIKFSLEIISTIFFISRKVDIDEIYRVSRDVLALPCNLGGDLENTQKLHLPTVSILGRV